MMESEICFVKQDNGNVEIWYENDQPPFDDKLMGVLREDTEGYYRFHPARVVVMTCKHFRVVGKYLSELNRGLV
jgi:hypothetical protein